MAGMIPGAQYHFWNGCRMGTVFRLAAALGLSEAPELGADSLCLKLEQIRHQVQILDPWHVILVT